MRETDKGKERRVLSALESLRRFHRGTDVATPMAQLIGCRQITERKDSSFHPRKSQGESTEEWRWAAPKGTTNWLLTGRTAPFIPGNPKENPRRNGGGQHPWHNQLAADK
ncbi:uncharacterized protein ACOB8E_005994 [Sarcophilus harrisii]